MNYYNSELFAAHVVGIIVNYSKLFAVYFLGIIGICNVYNYYLVSWHGGVYAVQIHTTKAELVPSADQSRA